MSDLQQLLPQVDPQAGPWVLVTLVRARGSTYRKAGARLLVHPGGYLGMLSGGCLEAEVTARCASLLRGNPEPLEVDIDTRRLLGCDGTLTLVAEPLPPSLAGEIKETTDARKALELYTSRPGPGWRSTSSTPRPNSFVQRLLPPIKLLVFGPGPGALPLLQIARTLHWEAMQVVLAQDPAVARRREQGWLVAPTASALSQGWADARTCCVVMNHHVGRDCEVLKALWNTPSPFLGLLGSRRRRDEIVEKLAFWDSRSIDLEARTLYAPVGLDLGAEGAAEIALEVVAQVQRVMAGGRRARVNEKARLIPVSSPLAAALFNSERAGP